MGAGRNKISEGIMKGTASASTLTDGVVIIPRRRIHSSSLWLRPRRLSALPIFAERGFTVRLHRKSLDTRLGIRVVVYDPHTHRRGATVGSVDLHSLCWRAGLVAGDLITSITFDSGATVEVADGRAAMLALEGAHGSIVLGVRRRRWTDADVKSQRVQAVWRGALIRARARARANAAQLVQRTWRASARRRRAARAINLRPSILALARLSSGSTVGSTSQGVRSRRTSASSSEPSRRDSYEFRE